MLAAAFIIGATFVRSGYSIYCENNRPLTLKELIFEYMSGAHPDDIHKELAPIKQKQLNFYIKKIEKEDKIYLPSEIVKLISNFSEINLRNEKKLNELRLGVMSRKLNRLLSFADSEMNRLKKIKYSNKYQSREIIFALLCRLGSSNKRKRKVQFDAEVNLFMLYYYGIYYHSVYYHGIFKRLFTFKKDSKKEIKVFSKFYKKPLDRMKVLEKRRWCINRNEATYLFKNSRAVDIPLEKDLPKLNRLYDRDYLFRYQVLPDLPNPLFC